MFIKISLLFFSMSTKEKFRTYENVFDNSTLRTLFKLSSQGYFDELKSPISVGKESNVFSASKGKDSVIVKIYRVNACDFKRMYNYIAGDPRFKDIQKQRRKVIDTWARREFSNLLTARKAGARVPAAHAVSSNVLVMEFIGNNKETAPKLKDKTPQDLKKFSENIILSLKKMYTYKLVHGDLSEYNILNYQEKPVLIDLSHTLTLQHPNAQELLKRDIQTLVHYFTKKGLSLSTEGVLKKIKHGIHL